jgi:hypothetical protein
MTDESVPAEVSSDGPVDETSPAAVAEEPAEPSPGDQILKNLVILPPLQKDGTLPDNVNELQDSIPLPAIRAEEAVASIRAALGDICGYAHLTSFRFEVQDPPPPVVTKKASPSLRQASPYTGPNAVISYPVALKSLEEKPVDLEAVAKTTGGTGSTQIVLDEYGDLTPFLQKGLKDGSAFRIVLERYDALSIRNHIVRLRLLLEGSAPHSDTLDDGAGNGEEAKAKDDPDEDPKNDKTSSDADPKEEKTEAPKDEKEKKEHDAKDLPVFPIGKPLSPDVNDLKNFFYYACGEDPNDFLGDGSSSKKENDSKSKKKNKKKKDSKTNANTVDGVDNSEESDLSMKDVIPELNRLEEKVRIPCSIKHSGFHPPPSFRRLMGDLVYLEVTLPDGEVVHVTGTPMGFYVNQSVSTGNNKVFNPSPAKKPCFSHELLDCLLQHSTAMQEAWAQATSASKRRTELMSKINEDGPFFSYFRVAVRGDFPGYSKVSVASAAEGIDSLIQNPSWLVPIPKAETDAPDSWNRNASHVYNTTRTEEELSNSFGVDVRNGALRDWNEELQVAREMPTQTLHERIERAR